MAQVYQQAIEYYEKLKDNFIKQCEEHAQQTDSILSAKINADILEDVTNTPITKDFSSTASLNNSIEKIYADFLEIGTSGTSELSSIISKIKQGYWKTQKSMNKHIRDWLYSTEGVNIKNRIEEAIWTAAGGSFKGGDITDLFNRISSMFTRGVANSATSVAAFIQNEKYILAGYFHELSVAQATQQLPGMLMTHVGTENTQADIIYTMQEGGTQQSPMDKYKNTLERIQRQLVIATTVPTPETEMFEAYGNQVKSWELSKTQARIQGYSISHQQGLLNTLGENKSQVDSVIFFKKQQNAVVQTFGPLNVMYFTGKNRWWTSDLIKTAVENKYRLMFNQGKAGKLTASVKLDTKAYHWTELYQADSI